ncbi:fibronectin type III domain-containing protein [Bacillus sp. FJAT-50079]|uniref:fibronectin type III domain-containing protein n=1 Tax=Bacillus sp. FJAT-50079 TaxID=2833577 RepID=UPI001BC9AC55|nr:fibronectin type III domain-containing protein [Bacillus sp. FJAT-50079]MBS4209459.1 metallophosphoesterase [Bacillus sp. FJAT-50079]
MLRKRMFILFLCFLVFFNAFQSTIHMVHAKDLIRLEHDSVEEELGNKVVHETEVESNPEIHEGVIGQQEALNHMDQTDTEVIETDETRENTSEIDGQEIEESQSEKIKVDNTNHKEAENIEERSIQQASLMADKINQEISEPYIVLEDFENGIGSWNTSGAKYNSINASITTDVVRFGQNALKLDYDFTDTQGTSGIYASTDKIVIPGNPVKIGMWVYGDGHKHWLRQQLTDANGQNFNIDFTPSYPNGVTWQGWKYVEATIPTTWVAPYSMGSQAIRYMATSDDAKTAGTIYIDSIRAVYYDSEEDVINPGLSNFKPADQEIDYFNQPEISAVATDNEGGSGINAEQIFMKVDGKSVAPTYDSLSGKIAYTPASPLAEGLHEVWIEVFDHAGNHKFHTWNFFVSTDGPAFGWKGSEKAYAGSTFEVQITMENVDVLSGTEVQLSYNSNLLELVDAAEEIEGIQVNIPDKLKDSVITHEVNNETGKINLKWANLDKLTLEKNEALATLTFRLGLDATGYVKLEATNGSLTYLDPLIGTIPFFMEPYIAEISQPLTLYIEGKSLNTPSTIKVKDQNGNPVEGAKIEILDGNNLIKVLNPTDIYKGGSGIAGDPYQQVDVGTYMPYANKPYAGFDYYRIYMPDGQQRYYHVPKQDVEEVEWSSVFDQTDENGEVKTDLLTLSRIPIRIQASKGELVSQVISFVVLPQLGVKTPENIVLTWVNDPKTTQHFTWRTNTAPQNSLVEVVPTSVEEGFKSNQVQRFDGENELFADQNETGEMIIHRAEATGLTPGVTYQYRVGDGSDEGWSEVGTFKTESASEKEPFNFLFFTDTQAYDPAGFALWTQLYQLGLEKFPDSRFALHSGDIVEDGSQLSQWEYFLNAAQELTTKIPLLSVLGNHDVYGDGANMYNKLFPNPQNGPEGKQGFVYSFDYGDARFIMLNSEFGVSDMKEQQEWIRQEVENSDKHWTIAMFHRSPYASNPLRGRDATAETFSPILEELGVDLVLTGHDHAYMRSYLMKDGQPQLDGQGTQYIIGGSAGPKFYPAESYDYVDVLYDTDKQIFTSITVDGEEIKGEVYTIDNELVDTFTLEKQFQAQEPEPEPETPIEDVDEDEQEQIIDKDDPINSEDPSSDEVENGEKNDSTSDNKEGDNVKNETEKEMDKKVEVSERGEKIGIDKGKPLPNTATSMYNWLLAGVVLLVLSGGILVAYRRARNNQLKI